jgi:hypothetical protein
MGDFEVDTRVEGSGGKYRADLSADWEIWGPNGGYVAAIALRAAGCEAEIPRPATFACHFLSVARFGPVDIGVTLVRRGRRSESFRVSIEQEGRPIVEALVRTAAEVPGLEHDVAEAPDVPDPEDLRCTDELRDPEWPTYAFWSNLEARTLHPERFGEEPQAHEPIWREWYRFRPRPTFDDPFVDAGRALLLIDTLSWPAPHEPRVPRTEPGRLRLVPPLGSRIGVAAHRPLFPRRRGGNARYDRACLEPRPKAPREWRSRPPLHPGPTPGLGRVC